MERRMYEDTARFQDRHWYFVGMREIVLALFGSWGSGRSLRILDLGCGTGQYLPWLSRLGRVVGVDSAPEALTYCSRNGGAGSLIIQADVRRLPFRSQSFDLVWASSILEHLQEDGSSLREGVRVLKPGGRVMISVPAHRFLWGHNDELAHHWRRYSRGEVEKLCRDCGLRIIRITNYGTTPMPLAWLVRKIKNYFGHFSPGLKNISDFRLASFPDLRFFFLSVLRLEKRGLRRVNLPFGLMLYVLAEKDLRDPDK